MKVEAKTFEPTFAPCSVTITFEKPEELEAFWHRVNMNSNAFHQHYSLQPSKESKAVDGKVCYSIFTVVDDLRKEKSYG